MQLLSTQQRRLIGMQGFSQSTFYDANGDIVGYGDSWSDDWDGDGNVDSTGQSFMDENWDYVGGSWSDDYGSGHNFSIKTVVNDVTTQIQEIGENTWTDYEGNDQTNIFNFIYDGNWNLISGTEERGQKGTDGTLSGGEKVTYGANWEILSVSRDVNLTSEKIAELSVDRSKRHPDSSACERHHLRCRRNCYRLGD